MALHKQSEIQALNAGIGIGHEDLKLKIRQLKKEKNAIILAHYYQEPAIQEVADYIGDSLGLSQEAANAGAEIIVFAGVQFMAETAKILNPGSKVLVPDPAAGCSLADSCDSRAFREFRERHPHHLAITYVNCSAEVKAYSDIVCTSSNALKIIKAIPVETPIIFAPDKNLGRYLISQTGREMLLWNGACEVHTAFSLSKLQSLMKANPDAELVAHPESKTEILELANFIGSTSAMIKYVASSLANKFIIATEAGILHQMALEVPGKTLLPVPAVENNSCACSECRYMKMNTLEKLYKCLDEEINEVHVDEAIRLKALKPLERMIQMSN